LSPEDFWPGRSNLSTRLQFEAWVPFPVAQVFAFFSNPENLPLLTPAATRARIADFA
jgi:ligand-binding SRPBCC domain-containing protein